jgi:ABC-2 type transport system permease protein
VTSPEPRTPGSAALVRLVAAREVSSRIRDKNFIVSSLVIIVLLLGLLAFQVVAGSGDSGSRLGIVGDDGRLGAAVQAQAEAVGVDVEVVDYTDERRRGRRSRTRRSTASCSTVPARPRSCWSPGGRDAGGPRRRRGQRVAISDRLLEAGVDLQSLPEVAVTPLGGADDDGQRVVVAVIGVVVLYGLLLLFAQFVAQGVVEEKSSRVVELLLATMRPWQLLAGKILGLGLLGLGQMWSSASSGVTAALALDVVEVPGEVIGTVVTVVAWFVLGYAFYASVFAVAASLVSRQEDLGSVLTPAVDAAHRRIRRLRPGGRRPRGHAGHGDVLRPRDVTAGDAGPPGGGRGRAVGGRAGRRPHAAGHRAGRPPRRSGLRRRAAAHEREDQDPRGTAGRARLREDPVLPPRRLASPGGSARACEG